MINAESTEKYGLLATGASRCWSVAVDESLDCDEWSLEIDGPSVYLVFQLDGLKQISAAVSFLASQLAGQRADKKWSAVEDSLPIGRFGQDSVELARDNEYERWFIVVAGPQSTLRATLSKDDATMLLDALRQVEVEVGSP